ncbi:hypothetical protein ACIP3B_36300 [Streptomyces anulatus]|uniref:hypothetical protein n=1 Tax=Streptomyces anulatus TaxID=1892 RepID=UPI0033FB5CD5
MKRRAFLTASTAAALSLVHRLGETLVRGRLTMADTGRITTAVGRPGTHFTAVGGPLLTVATAYTDRLRGNADSCTYDPARPTTAPPAMLLRPPAPVFGAAFGTVFGTDEWCCSAFDTVAAPGSRPVRSRGAVVSWCGCRSRCRGRR